MRRIAVLSVEVALTLGGCSGGSVERPVHQTPQPIGEAGMNLTSSAFQHEGIIPTRYTCDGPDVSPPLELSDIPDGAVTLAIVMDDPDAPRGVWDHWVAYDIPPTTEIIIVGRSYRRPETRDKESVEGC